MTFQYVPMHIERLTPDVAKKGYMGMLKNNRSCPTLGKKRS